MRTLLLACTVVAAFGAARTAATHEVEGDTALTSVKDLLRGFNDAEMAAARRELANRPSPGPPAVVRRTVTVSGTVFIDANRNGALDTGESGIAGVRVSDGERIARTDERGAFTLPLDIDEDHFRFVSIVRPTGYRPTDGWWFRVPPNEKRTVYTADFGLAEDEAAARDSFCFVAASDSQFTAPDQMIRIGEDYRQITSSSLRPAFLVTVGDLTMNGSHREWDMYDRIRRSSQIPVYEGFGGHDGNCLKPSSTRNFEQRIGPTHYSWDYGGIHFVQFVSETGYLSERARARQAAWLKADLAGCPRGTGVIVLTHLPLPAEWFDQKLAEGVNVLCQLGAHWHCVQAGSRGDVPVLLAAPARGRDWGAYSRTYRYVHVDRGKIKSELRVAGQYARLELLVPAPSALMGEQPLVALAYDTGRKVEAVTCEITRPDGTRYATELAPRGDWSWYGRFEPRRAGRWGVRLVAQAVGGELWERDYSVEVRPKRLAPPSPSADFPWLLAGTPPRNAETGPTPPLYPRWVRHTGGVHVLHSSPAVAAGRVYVGFGNPNAAVPDAGLLCIDTKTGEVLWKARSPRGDVRGSVTVHDGCVYLISGEGWAAAFAAETGELLWSRPLAGAYRRGRPLAINQAPPVPTEHGLLVSDFREPQYLLAYADGKTLRRFDGNTGQYASFATAYSGRLFYAARGGAGALDLRTGDALWRADESSRATSAGVVIGDKLIHAGTYSVKARHAATGTVLWESPAPSAGYQRPIPVAWGDAVLLNGSDFSAFDLATGELRWSIRCATEASWFHRSRRQVMAGSSSPVVAGGHAYFGHDDTSLRAIDPDGRVVWQFRAGTPIKTSPAVSGNLLYLHDYAGNLWCFSPAE